MRAENTESRNIEHQLHLQAIGHAQIAFTFARDDRVVFQLPATAALNDRIRDLYGNELLQQLLPLDGANSSQIRISGLIGRAGLSRQTRAQQLVFVNGRAIESPVITAAVREVLNRIGAMPLMYPAAEGESFPNIQDENQLRDALQQILQRERTQEIVLYLLSTVR